MLWHEMAERVLQGEVISRQEALKVLAVPEEEFTVRADIDDKHHFILVIGLFGNEHAHVVSTHKPGLDRKHMDIGRRINLQPEITGLDVQGILHRGDKGRTADVLRVKAE